MAVAGVLKGLRYTALNFSEEASFEGAATVCDVVSARGAWIVAHDRSRPRWRCSGSRVGISDELRLGGPTHCVGPVSSE